MTSTATRQAGIPTAGSYRLDPSRSAVSFRTRHLFGLAAVTGTMAITGGDIIVDTAIPQASVTATVSAASFDTGHRRRDRDIRSARFLHTEQYPSIRFRATFLRHVDGRWSLSGELTVRDVTRPVILVLETIEPSGAGFCACATTRLDRYAFGVSAAKGMAARYLDIDLTVAAEPRQSAAMRRNSHPVPG